MHKVLHVSLEYKYGLGELKAVMSGLLPALQDLGINTSIITPYYNFLNQYANDLEFKEVATIKHFYKKIIHTSLIFQVTSPQCNLSNQVILYLVKPAINSSVAKIFDLDHEQNIYKAFDHSEPQNRLEYFNSAVAVLVKTVNSKIPRFDIIHTHTWHTSLSICLIKNFEKTNLVNIIPASQLLAFTPKIISTIHMLSDDQGILSEPDIIKDTLESINLPLDPELLIDNKYLNQLYLSIQHADQVLAVSNAIITDLTKNQNNILIHPTISNTFNLLDKYQRADYIHNGITVEKFNPCLEKNLHQLAINIKDKSKILTNKNDIKQFLTKKYPMLNNNLDTIWLLYVGRFSPEKGIDMLPFAYEVINKYQGNFIIMGFHTTERHNNPNIYQIIDDLKTKQHVLIINNRDEQNTIGKYFRAASDFTIIPSHFEACGLVAMEAMLNFSFAIAANTQGLPEIIKPFNNNNIGTGFIYNNDIKNRTKNLQKTLDIAYKKYTLWRKTNTLNNLLYNLHQQGLSYDWHKNPGSLYKKLYQKTINNLTISDPNVQISSPIIKVLHVALEYKICSVGGLGTVTTELVSHQNRFRIGTKFNSSIITPYYTIFNQNKGFNKNTQLITTVAHTYNHQEVHSEIHLNVFSHNKHFAIKPNPNYEYLFDISNIYKIYSADNNFTDRIKYFNSAVAAFIANNKYFFDIIQLHEWPTALISLLMKNKYSTNKTPLVYTIHTDDLDTARYSYRKLLGIGVELYRKRYNLKTIGIEYSDYIVTVSNAILEENATMNTKTTTIDGLQKNVRTFLKAKYNHTAIAILNGINYSQSCHIKKITYNLSDRSNILAIKNLAKQQLACNLNSDYSVWKINPALPLILYVGRFSKEKGIDYFKNLINILSGRAMFFAIGRGMNKDILEVILNYSKKQDNIFITFSSIEQQKYGDLMRTAADFIFVPSHKEACGLVALEGLANGSVCITSGAGGLKEFIKPLYYTHRYWYGNGFIYEDYNLESFNNTINRAINTWELITDRHKNTIYNQITEEARQFDWEAPNGALTKYYDAYKNILAFKEAKLTSNEASTSSHRYKYTPR